MKRLTAFVILVVPWFIFLDTVRAGEVTVMVKGSVWDSDSRGFAWYQRLNKQQGTIKAARRGARVSVDGQPDVFAISGEGGSFELTLTTSEPTFRLVVEGDRFPRTITQPYEIPEDEGELDVGRVNTPRAEGTEHTWPLPMMANALGYTSTREMLADNKAAIRMGLLGSGADGAPEWTYPAKLSFPKSNVVPTAAETTTSSPFLMRIPQSEYVVPFDMTPQDTYFMKMEENTGFFIVIVAFGPDEDIDKDVVIAIEDTVTDELLDPPRPWKFSPKTVSVRNGFATEVRFEPDIDLDN